MKKTVGMILILVLSLSLMAAASAEYDDVIRFQELPWGTSLEAVSTLYPQFEEETVTGAAVSLNKLAIKNSDPDYTLENKGQATCLVFSSSDNVIHIGPYDCNSITMYFAYVPEADGSLAYTSSNTSLYAGQYRFSASVAGKKKTGDILNGLIKKLNLLYGEYDSEIDVPWKDSKEKETIGKAYIWKGANDTEVVLYSAYGKDGNAYKNVYLTYYTKAGDQLLKNADAAADPDSAAYKRLFEGCSGL